MNLKLGTVIIDLDALSAYGDGVHVADFTFASEEDRQKSRQWNRMVKEHTEGQPFPERDYEMMKQLNAVNQFKDKPPLLVRRNEIGKVRDVYMSAIVTISDDVGIDVIRNGEEDEW